MTELTWQTVCTSAIENAKGLTLEFASHYQDSKCLKGPCKLIGGVIEPNETYDEESLPVYSIELADGTRIDALEEELGSSDEAGFRQLIEGVSMTFGLARVLGDWAGPTSLMESADPATRHRFLELIQAPPEDKALALA